MTTTPTTSSGTLTGVPAAAGVAQGRAFICHCDEPPEIPRRTIRDTDAAAELVKFDAAVTETYGELLRLEAGVLARSGEPQAGIFTAQRQMLHDPMLRSEVSKRCLGGPINIEAAVADAIAALAAGFAKLDDPVFAERAADVRDVGRRLLTRLLAHQAPRLDQLPPDSIIVAHELLPSLAASLVNVRGLVAERGGTTAHAVILARSLGIPAVIRVDGATRRIQAGDPLIVDALAGRVLVRPSDRIRGDYQRIEAGLEARRKVLAPLANEPAVTRDGTAIRLSANAGNVGDAAASAACHADAIGLYRTEFAFLVQTQFPSEEEQYRTYRAAAEQIAPRPIVIRVLGFGSDKLPAYFPLPPETNPALGRRGTRLLLGHPEILQPQLRAILRLGATHAVSLLFPMIGGVDEFRAARRAVEEAKVQLEREGQPFARAIPVGAMIETPAAAITARALAAEADFLSIGSNDLVQYLLTADRTSSGVAEYYEPLHPAVLDALKQIIDAATLAGKPVSLCGEIAGHPAYTPLLLGLGLRSFSVAPAELLDVKRAVRSVHLSEARRLAARALAAVTIAEVKAALAR